MRLRRYSPLLLSSVLFLPTLTNAQTINCEHVKVDGVSFNFEELDNPYSVMTSTNASLAHVLHNTTYTINFCSQLKKLKDVPTEQQCPTGTRVCRVKRLITLDGHVDIDDVTSVAGDYPLSSGRRLDAQWSRLKSSDSPTDREKEGLRLSMEGGTKKDKQKAVVEFLCPPKQEDRRRLRRGKDDDTEEVDDGHDGRLKYISYQQVEDTMVLSLEWTTKYACENAKNKNDEDKTSSGHWGFFTWLIIIFFLGTAAYLIFGSWLNYNRYSARGWDLLPHSETIRDIPYLLRDWMRRVVNTIQGGGSRGGYSAV